MDSETSSEPSCPSGKEEVDEKEEDKQRKKIQNKDEINSEILELTDEKHLEPSDNHHSKSDQEQKLATSPSQVSNQKELLSDLPGSRTEISNNVLEDHAQPIQHEEEINSEIPQQTKEEHLQLSDNHHPKSDQEQKLGTGTSCQASSQRELLSDLSESRMEISNNVLEDHAQPIQNEEEINSELPQQTKEEHLQLSDNHHSKSDQEQKLATSPSQVSNQKELLSDLPESRTEISNNVLEDHAQPIQNEEEINLELPQQTKEEHLEPSDNYHPKSDQEQKLGTGTSCQASSQRELLSDLPESRTEISNNVLEDHAQPIQNEEEINSELPQQTKEEHLQLSDNHHSKSDQEQKLATSPSQVSNQKELLSDLPESRTEISNNVLEDHAQPIQNEEEINSELPQQTKEEHLEPSDNHHPKSDQEQKLGTGTSCQASSQRELLSDLPESRTEISNNVLEDHAQPIQNEEEINSELPQQTKEEHLEPSDNYHPKSDQEQKLGTGTSCQASSQRELLSDLSESRMEISNNVLEDHAQPIQNEEEINSELPQQTKEEHLQLSDNHHSKSDQEQKLATSPSQVSNQKELLSDLPESRTEISNNVLEDHAQPIQNEEEINLELPQQTKEEHLEPSDNYHPKSDQEQKLGTGTSCQASSKKELLSDLPESRTEISNNVLEEHAQPIQNEEEINSEIPQQTKEEHLEPSDNYHPKSDQEQKLGTGTSCQASSKKELLSDLPESRTEISNNVLEEHAQPIQNEEEINSEIPQQTKEEHLEPSDNHHPKSDQEQKLGTGTSCQASSQRELLSDLSESRMEISNNDLVEILRTLVEKHLRSSDKHHSKSNQEQKLGTGHDRLDQNNYDKNWKTLRLFGKGEYVDGKWKKNRLMELYSCKFTHPDNNQTIHIRKQSPGYLFTIDEDDFLARVSFDKLEELDFAILSANIKRDFFKKLIIIEIIRDKSINDWNAAYGKLKQLFQDRSGKTVDNLEYAEDIFQLPRILESYRNSSKGSILDSIVNNTYISSDFKDACQQLLHREEVLNARRKVYSQFDQFNSKNVFVELHEIYERAVKNHKTSLLDKCSFSIPQLAYSLESNIDALSEQQLLCISNKDIDLLSDLANEMGELFSKFLNHLQRSLFSKVMEAKNHKSLKELTPLTHPIYFYLCKHFQELILEISRKTHISSKDLLIIDAQERLNLVKTITWPSTSLLNYSLEQQYRFIFKLMQHFEPGYNSKKGKFKYECKLLKSSDKTLLQRFQGLFLGSNTSSDIPEERLVWIYVLDDAIAQLFPKESEKCLELFMALLEGYRAFIQETEDDHYESFRIVMHNTIRFIAQAIPYLSKGASEIDETTLTNQIESIKNAISQKQFIDFRDFVDVYNEYWKNRESVIEKIPDKFPYGKFKKDMERIRQKLFHIVNTVLHKEVKPRTTHSNARRIYPAITKHSVGTTAASMRRRNNLYKYRNHAHCVYFRGAFPFSDGTSADGAAVAKGLIKYFRSYNEFLEDLSAVEFSWFIKKFTGLSVEEVELVNKDKKSYKVLDPENFIKKHENIPSHYLIEIIDDLLNIVNNLLEQKEWYDLNAASELVSAIRKSLIYLKEQPNYLSFITYREESTKPFACVVENCSSYEDFMKRVEIIAESFWYLRKQDEIDIKEALLLYKKANYNIPIETLNTLMHCYYRYLKKFNSYIQRTLGKNYVDKIEFITEEVNDQLELININEWDGKFKKETLPELLAGVAAVWSVQASKDIESVEKILQPHCIQVLCILLLLSVDKDKKGVEKHFAQVLTGQGKSLVLGLISSLLALTGHKVRTVCYSEYLATRDQGDFDNLFMVFDISHKITYGTFEEMANEVLEPMINGKRQGLRQLVEDRILNHSTEQLGHVEYEDTSNTILLIDEVDVFFFKTYYGNCYLPCTIIGFPALIGIQEKIWEMACKNYGKSVILKEVEEFIKNQIAEGNQDFKQFNQFLLKPGKYYLLKDASNVLIKKEYTNRSLYEEELNTMIDNAMYTATASNEDPVISKFKINDYGIISYTVDYHPSSNSNWMYYNVFNYFRLKRIGYDHKEYENYGYLIIDCGSISYAKLPKKYPLILGVSGTLTTLHDHEREAVRNAYSIYENSIIPSYFGDSNLKFDKYSDFISENSEEKWLSKIYDRANSEIRSGRSVLIFFDTDVQIDKFKNKFCGKFDRLHTLTEDTELQTKQKYIDEAGIAKTVTLATKGMGRGIDFKSSVAVEKKDGVHVIQTFFSLDIKEEIQIKGRTARKHHKGSYELILCKGHLINAKLIDAGETTVSYDSLSQSREKIIKRQYSYTETQIKRWENQHQITMNFLESFYKN